MAKDKVQIEIELIKDQYLKGLITIQEAQKKWHQAWLKGEKQEQEEIPKTTRKIKEKASAIGKLRMAYLAVLVVIYKLIQMFGEMTNEAIKFVRTEGQLRQGAKRVGTSLRELKRIISDEKGGMFSQTDVQAAVAYASVNGLMADQIEALLPLVRDAAALFGEDLLYGMTAIINAMKTGDALMARRIGLQLSEKQLNEASLEIFGEKLSQLTATGKAEVVYATAIKQLSNFLGAENDLLDTNIGKLSEQEAKMADLRVEIGERLIPVKAIWYNVFNYFLAGINEIIDGWEYLIALIFKAKGLELEMREPGETPGKKQADSLQRERELQKDLDAIYEKMDFDPEPPPGSSYPDLGPDIKFLTEKYKYLYGEDIKELRAKIEAERNYRRQVDKYAQQIEDAAEDFTIEPPGPFIMPGGGGGKAEELPKTIEDYAEEFEKQTDNLNEIWQMQESIGEEFEAYKDLIELWRGQLEELVEAGYQYTPLYNEIITRFRSLSAYMKKKEDEREALDRDMKALKAWVDFSRAGYAQDPGELYPPPDPEHKHPQWYLDMIAKGKKKELKAEHIRDMRNSLVTMIPNILTKGFTDIREALRMLVQNMGTLLGDLVAGAGIPSFGENLLGAGVGAIFGLVSTMIGRGGGTAWGEGGAIPVNVVEFLGQRDPFPLPSSAYFSGDRGGDINITINGDFPEGLTSAVQETVQGYMDDQRRGNI